jgi:hypothetical protein
MNIEELRIQAAMGVRGGNTDAFLRRLELAKICPEFPIDRTQETRISPPTQASRSKHGLFNWATRRFLKQR